MAKKTQIEIHSRLEADMALQHIGELERHIAIAETKANEKIDEIKEDLVDETELWRATLEANEKALEAWALEHKDEFKSPRSIELNFGAVGFRWTPWKIVILGRLKIETVIERLKANRMKDLIRTKEEVNREKALNYLNSDLAAAGLKKTRKDEFFYKVKQEEVKG